jgi:hypothetical protein
MAQPDTHTRPWLHTATDMTVYINRIILILALVHLNSCSSPSQTMLEKVKSLNLNSVEGKITTNYSPLYKDRAETVHNLLLGSVNFFETSFQVSRSFSIAVIDKAGWSKITGIPYGMPFVSGPPYVVCLPACSDNPLSAMVAEAIAGYGLGDTYGMTDGEIADIFISLIGFHELGHIYSREYGIRFPNKWTYEFAATYLAHFYLEENHPKESRIWVDVSRALSEELKPVYTSLRDFEEKYLGVGIESYAWYQAVFLLRVVEVYRAEGAAFLAKMKEHHWPAASAPEFMKEMEDLAPGFFSWSQKYHLN